MDKDFITEFGGAVLAGGASKRMGFNKALLEIDWAGLLAVFGSATVRSGCNSRGRFGPNQRDVGF